MFPENESELQSSPRVERSLLSYFYETHSNVSVSLLIKFNAIFRYPTKGLCLTKRTMPNKFQTKFDL